jgi:type IV pilus assembly protein PilW
MTTKKNTYKFFQAKAFTLVELMITLVLSLMITYAIAQVLISSNRTSVTSDGMSQSQETGRFVMSYLAKHIRLAGFDKNGGSTPAFVGCDNFPALKAHRACITEAGGGENQDDLKKENTTHGDLLAITKTLPSDELVDCTGNTGYWALGKDPKTDPIIAYAENNVIINTFWVAFDDTSQMNSLYCKGFLLSGNNVLGGSSAQAIANGVDAIQFLYGQADVSGSNRRDVTRYMPAAKDPDNPSATEISEWGRVYAVRVSILTRSITEVTNKETERLYVLANAEPYKLTDAVNRQVFNTTFTINNF